MSGYMVVIKTETVGCLNHFPTYVEKVPNEYNYLVCAMLQGIDVILGITA